MATVDLVMPKMGESIMEATILKWHKKPGDTVSMDETVLEIATDKVDTEVPSTEEGVIEELLYKENDVVPVGATIARIKTNISDSITQSEPEDQIHPQEEAEIFIQSKPGSVASASTSYNSNATSSSNGNRFYSPLVLNIAAQEGISLSELEKLNGTGNEGRVTKKDILDYVNRKRSDKGVDRSQMEVRSQEHKVQSERANTEENRGVSTVSRPAPTLSDGNVEIIEMDRMRRMISEHMVRSKHTSAHVTSFSEADVTW
jgi:2-oxoglutarate dehydrogenase E2 component (dihydrolipoamide succinyltransferase)